MQRNRVSTKEIDLLNPLWLCACWQLSRGTPATKWLMHMDYSQNLWQKQGSERSGFARIKHSLAKYKNSFLLQWPSVYRQRGEQSRSRIKSLKSRGADFCSGPDPGVLWFAHRVLQILFPQAWVWQESTGALWRLTDYFLPAAIFCLSV